MKTALFLCSIAIASAFYTDLDESIDIDGIMADPVKLKPYLDCYMDRQPCDKVAAAYKGHIVELFSNACQNCDPKFKHIAEVFILNLLVKFPDEMEKFKAKYDPTGVNLSKLVTEISKY